MADDLATLGFAVDTGGLSRGERALNSYASTGDKTERRTKGNATSMSKAYRGLASAIAVAASAAAGLSKIVSVQREFDVLNAQLVTATGNASNAARAFEAIQQFAAQTPYDLQQATKGFTQLVNLGLTPSEAAMRSYGNTASAMGKDLSQMIEAVADATTGEFERLKEFGIKSKSEGDKVSFTFQGVTKTVGKNAAEIEKYLMNIGKVNFAGSMINQMDTLNGKISNFGDSWDTLFLTISNNGVGDAMKSGVEVAIYYVNELTRIIESGQFNGVMDTVAKSWSLAFGNIANNMAIMGNSIIDDLNKIGLKGVDTSNLMSDAFFNFPANIKAAIEIATTELWAFAEGSKAIAKAISDWLTPFNGLTEVDIDATLGKALTEIDAKVSKSYANIKAVRDKTVVDIDNERQEVEKLESTYEALELAKSNEKGDALAEFKIKPKSIDTSGIEQIEKKVKKLKKTVTDADIFGSVTDSINQSLASMQSMSKQGSKEYKALGVAIAATNAIQAVGAVLNQGNGDPYSAPARMAAMVASVAALGVQIGGLSGGIGDESKNNQASQGLNVWGEKSESISNSMEMIENASEKLVGINTSMLKALQDMQAGIAKAAGLIARDVETPQVNVGSLGIFDGQIPVMDNMIGDLLSFTTGGLFTKAIGKLLGGSSKVVDEGIRIVGGTIDELINDITVQAFQKVKYKKYSFSSSKSKTVFKDITDQVGDQFSLVFKSLADAVYIGATTLGFAGSDVEKAINDFNIATTDISLKGLSAEDQQKEINSVFSKIFDDLAKDVIDFLPDMQKVGEGLGETLSRVATQVNIAEVAVDSFGFKFFDKMANPEIFAKAADNLSTLVGGVEEFAEKTSSFIDNFAPASVKLNVYSKSLTESLDAVGLTLPATSEGMFKLMQSLDGTTEEGQKQIAALLNIQGTSKEYYNLLEEQSRAMVNLSNSIQGAIDNIYSATRKTASMTLDAALTAARTGDFSQAQKLNFGALAPSQSDFSSSVDFKIAQAATANKLQELKDLTGGAVSIEDKTLAANEEQVKLLTSINNNLSGKNSTNGNQSADSASVVELKELKSDIKEITSMQEAQARNIADSNALLEQIVYDGINVRVEA